MSAKPERMRDPHPAPGSAAESKAHGTLMDGVYRRQRHIYDLTRKYYLLGRDRLIAELAPPDGGLVLELGCGTGRNLIAAAKAHPKARFFGLDISEEMLVTARASITKAGLSDRITVAQGDASAFSAVDLFGDMAAEGFDRVFISYALSMIPPWEKALEAGLDAVRRDADGHLVGHFSCVDFGDQAKLPRPFKSGLRKWLRKFHVDPRDGLPQALEHAALTHGSGGAARTRALYRGYAWYGTVVR